MSDSAQDHADWILHNGRVVVPGVRFESALAVRAGRVQTAAGDAEVMKLRGPATRVTDLCGRTLVPGLIDSHTHLIRGGLNYNLELRWDGVPSLADALRLLREQVQRTPPGQWVRVVGGFTEMQFAEKRLPTLDELNAVAPDTPVFILHLYDRALLNRAALRAVGYTRDTPQPAGGEIQRDKQGHPTGLLIARPNAYILYATLARGPRLSPEQQISSSRHFMRELNRLGVTSVIDAGGGFQNYPEDYAVIDRLHKDGQLTVRIAYNLFTQRPGQELEDFADWAKRVKPGQGDSMYRHNGAGEMLVFSAADFEDFLEPRPELAQGMEAELTRVVRLLAEQRWPFRIHATYDESIQRMLTAIEAVHRDVPLTGLHWIIDHAETISPRSIERVAAMGGGIAIQHRMAYQGEYFIQRYGAPAAAEAPPIRRILKAGVPLGAGTDATRVASYNPFVCLYWLVSGRSIGGSVLYGDSNRLDRHEALRLWTEGSAWFSTEAGTKGALAPGQLADFAVLSAPYFDIPEAEILDLHSLLTVVDGRPVYAAGEFADLDPGAPPVLPEWSPVRYYGGDPQGPRALPLPLQAGPCVHPRAGSSVPQPGAGEWPLSCGCFAF